MAGSYRHIINEDGSFRGFDLIDNGGDAAEAIVECYGMIQWLAHKLVAHVETAESAEAEIEDARKHWANGIRLGGTSSRIVARSVGIEPRAGDRKED